MNKRIDEVMTKEGLVTTHNSDLQRAADILLRNKNREVARSRCRRQARRIDYL